MIILNYSTENCFLIDSFEYCCQQLLKLGYVLYAYYFNSLHVKLNLKNSEIR